MLRKATYVTFLGVIVAVIGVITLKNRFPLGPIVLVLSVIPLGGLLLMKFISERPRDREDVEGILVRSGDEMDHGYVHKWLQVFAETLHQPSLVDEYEEYLRQFTD